jgi:hypothetical protein
MRMFVSTSVLTFAFFECALAQDSKLSTQFVDCKRNAKGENVASQEMKTPVFSSKTGNRTYGVVNAELAERSCRYTSRVYLSKGLGEFQVVFEQKAEQEPDSTWHEGSGVQNLRWSPDGKHLLIEIFQWTDGSDAGERTKYIIISSEGSANKEIHPEEAVQRSFKKECSALIESTGWIDETHIAMQVKHFIWTDEEGIPDKTPACVKKTMMFSFEVASGKVSPLAPVKTQ